MEKEGFKILPLPATVPLGTSKTHQEQVEEKGLNIRLSPPTVLKQISERWSIRVKNQSLPVTVPLTVVTDQGQDEKKGLKICPSPLIASKEIKNRWRRKG